MVIFRRLSAKFSRSSSSRNGVNGLPRVDESHSTDNSAVLTATTRNTTNASNNAATNITSNDKPIADARSNGTPTANGTSIAESLKQTKQVKRSHPSYSSKPRPIPEEPNNHEGPPATRENVEEVFEQFAHLIHVSRKPLPSQSGDGSYLEKEEPTGFWADFRNLSLKDVEKVKHIIEDKASGKPQDDRKMHMEEIMQVRHLRSRKAKY